MSWRFVRFLFACFVKVIDFIAMFESTDISIDCSSMRASLSIFSMPYSFIIFLIVDLGIVIDLGWISFSFLVEGSKPGTSGVCVVSTGCSVCIWLSRSAMVNHNN